MAGGFTLSCSLWEMMPSGADGQDGVCLLPNICIQQDRHVLAVRRQQAPKCWKISCSKGSSLAALCKHMHWHDTAGGWGRDIGSVAEICYFAISLGIFLSLTDDLTKSRRIKI